MTTDRLSPLTIALCGATGTGKSTFVNDASGGDLPVGHSAHSCTTNIMFAPTFDVDGVEVRLIDTPGFDDTTMSDTEILERIGSFLKASHMEDQHLSGVIYMHRITDNRVGGVSRRNFRVFRELVGPGALVNVMIVTNFWRDPPEQMEINRERELMESPMFFQPVLAKGARMTRYVRSQTPDSAHDIIRMFMTNIPKPTYLGEALADGVPLDETNPGKTLNEELQKLLDKQKAEMEALKQEHQRAMDRKDREAQEEIAAERKQSQERHDAILAQMAALSNQVGRYYEANKEQRAEIDRLSDVLTELKARLDRSKDEEERTRLVKAVAATEKQVRKAVSEVWNGICSFARGWRGFR